MKYTLLLGTLLGTLATNAEVLALYDFNGNGNSVDTSLYSSADIGRLYYTGGNVQINDYIATRTYDDVSSRRAGIYANDNGSFQGMEDATLSTSSSFYFRFGITVQGLEADQTLNLSSITYTVGESGSTTNFHTAVIEEQSRAYMGTSAAYGAGYTEESFSLTHSTTQDLYNGDTVYFRLLFSNNGVGSTATRLFLDDLTINGTVVPEPTAISLLGLGGLALVTRRKR